MTKPIKCEFCGELLDPVYDEDDELVEGEYYACECEDDDTGPYFDEDDFDDCC